MVVVLRCIPGAKLRLRGRTIPALSRLACATLARQTGNMFRCGNRATPFYRLLNAAFCCCFLVVVGRPAQVSAQEASDCRAKLARDILELGNIVSVKTGHVSKKIDDAIETDHSRPRRKSRLRKWPRDVSARFRSPGL